jgi:hypothetical protein
MEPGAGEEYFKHIPIRFHLANNTTSSLIQKLVKPVRYEFREFNLIFKKSTVASWSPGQAKNTSKHIPIRFHHFLSYTETCDASQVRME